MKKVLIPTKLPGVAKKILEGKGYKVIQDSEMPLAELVKKESDGEALIVRSEKVTAAIIDALPKLKAVVRAGAGYDNIDIKYARSKKIDVMNTPGANANGVAEEAVGMMLAAARFFIPGDQTTRAGQWEKSKYTGTELAGKTIGVVGLGNIGRLVCKRLAGFEVKLLGYDPFISADKAREMNVEMVSLEDIFKRSHYVTLHLPGGQDTKGMVDEKLLMLMPEGATLINCARAGIINEEDLRKVKPLKKLKFCNDVYTEDKAGEKSIKDIADIMLPHLGASTVESNINAAQRAAEELIDLWEKGITRYVVNSSIPEGLDEKYQELA
ncbi:MAG: phosphoglycerate dehydrogenase, partial [Candidatus Aureabacteria bacterium]|nr:phosphoglycerate dehydrogenase [Candidatus Auribacterota bacterium]